MNCPFLICNLHHEGPFMTMLISRSTPSSRDWQTFCPNLTAGPCWPLSPRVRISLENAVEALASLPTRYESIHTRQVARLTTMLLAPILQGDPSGWQKPPIDLDLGQSKLRLLACFPLFPLPAKLKTEEGNQQPQQHLQTHFLILSVLSLN